MSLKKKKSLDWVSSAFLAELYLCYLPTLALRALDGAGCVWEHVFGFAENLASLKLAMDLSSELVVNGEVIEHSGAKTVGATCGVTLGAATVSTPPTYTTVTTGC